MPLFVLMVCATLFLAGLAMTTRSGCLIWSCLRASRWPTATATLLSVDDQDVSGPEDTNHRIRVCYAYEVDGECHPPLLRWRIAFWDGSFGVADGAAPGPARPGPIQSGPARPIHGVGRLSSPIHCPSIARVGTAALFDGNPHPVWMKSRLGDFSVASLRVQPRTDPPRAADRFRTIRVRHRPNDIPLIF